MTTETRQQYIVIVSKIKEAALAVAEDLKAERIEPGRLCALQYRQETNDYGPCCIGGHVLVRAFPQIVDDGLGGISVMRLFKSLLKWNGLVHSGVTPGAAWSLVQEPFQPLMQVNDDVTLCVEGTAGVGFCYWKAVSTPERRQLLVMGLENLAAHCDTLIQKTIPAIQELQ